MGKKVFCILSGFAVGVIMTLAAAQMIPLNDDQNRVAANCSGRF